MDRLINKKGALVKLGIFIGLIAVAPGFINAQPINEDDFVLIQNARVITGNGSVIENGFLEFKNGVITRVSIEPIESNPDTLIINATGKTIIPALIDAHAHLGYQGRVTFGSDNYGRENLIDNLEQYAYYGFSAVFSAGSDAPNIVNEVESARQAGEFIGARMLYAAGMASPGQGPNDSFLTHVLAVEESSGETILYGLESPSQARAQVQLAAEKEIQFIKIWVDDRGGSQDKLSPDIYRAVIQEAISHDLKVFVHQQYASDIPDLLSAGVHGFLHGRLGEELGVDIANQIREEDAFIIPNLGLNELRQESIGSDSFLSEIFDDSILQPLTAENSNRQNVINRNTPAEIELRSSFGLLIDAGADFILGTDAGCCLPLHPFGYTGHRELESYVRLGMTPMQAIISGTSNGARHLGLANQGQLQSGYTADLIILSDNPLDDIRNTRSIEQVFIQGKEVNRSALRQKWKP